MLSFRTYYVMYDNIFILYRKFEVKFDEAFQKNEYKLSLPSALVENTNKLTVKDISPVRSNSNKSSLRYVSRPTNALYTKVSNKYL